MVKGLAFLFPFAMESQREKKAFNKKIKNKAASLGWVIKRGFSFPSRWDRYGKEKLIPKPSPFPSRF